MADPVTPPLEYPEHAKLQALGGRPQACGDFLAWLHDKKGLVLCEPQDTRQFEGYPYLPASVPTHKLLAEYFEIDEDRLEAEKRRLLDGIRTAEAARHTEQPR